MKTLQLPDALKAAGVNVRILDGWQQAHKNGSYKWRESPEDPAGAMWHHTATTAYTPNRDKASAWAGLGILGSSRLYQSVAGDAFPVYTIANAHPAPVSSGYGVRRVLDEYVKRDVAWLTTQPWNDDNWAGNTHYWNTEVILDGVGGEMREDVWDMLVVVGQTLDDLFGWTPARHIGHAMHTGRKIDLRDGRWPDMASTIGALRVAIAGDTPELPPVDPPLPGDDYVRPILRQGDGYVNGENPDVRGAVVGVQQQLAYHGFADRNTADGSSCAADGAFGTGTDTAVRSFQSAKRLVVDGVVGDMTYVELDLPKS